MRRRQVLAALAGSATGFSSCFNGSSHRTASETTTPRTCRSPAPREVSLVETAALPPALDISMSASMKRSRVTTEAPARLQVTLTNDGTYRNVFPHGDDCDPFNRSRGESHPEGLWLYIDADLLDSPPDQRLRNCWKIPHPKPQPYPLYGCLATPLDAGVTRSWTYEVWDHPSPDAYYPPGRYRFPTEVWVGEAESSDEGVGRSNTTVYEWWLDLRVVRPDS